MPNKDISQMTYREATQELEEILRAIESDSVDVDELTQKVQRSSQLIKFCKDKLRHAENAINQVFNEENCDDISSKTEKNQGGNGNLFQ